MNEQAICIYLDYFQLRELRGIAKIGKQADWYGRYSNSPGTLFCDTYKTTAAFKIRYWSFCCGLFVFGVISSPLWVPLLIKEASENLWRRRHYYFAMLKSSYYLFWARRVLNKRRNE